MRYLKFFEAWSSKFHKDLQAAYAQAELTNKGHGKIKKDILAYTTRQVSEEKFTIVTGNGSEIDFYINPEFLLKSKTLCSEFVKLSGTKIAIEIIITGIRLVDEGLIQWAGKSYFDKLEVNWGEKVTVEFNYDISSVPEMFIAGLGEVKTFVETWTRTVYVNELIGRKGGSYHGSRFKTKRMLEDFITMVTKAMLSVPGQTPDNIEKNKALLQKLIDTNQNYFL